MSFASSRFPSRRRKRSSSLPDLRHVIAYRKVVNLRHEFTAVIGSEGTGRNTIVRRFLNMSDGPFDRPEDRRHNTRFILVDLSQRPNIPRTETVHLCVFIFTLQQLNFQTIYQTIDNLKSSAVVFDVTCSTTFRTAIHCMVRITELLGRRAPMLILVGNKIDLPQHEVLTVNGINIAARCGAERYYATSALMNVNMNPVLDAILIMTLFEHTPPAQ